MIEVSRKSYFNSQIAKYEPDVKIDKFKKAKLIKNDSFFKIFYIRYIDFAILTSNSYSSTCKNL